MCHARESGDPRVPPWTRWRPDRFASSDRRDGLGASRREPQRFEFDLGERLRLHRRARFVAAFDCRPDLALLLAARLISGLILPAVLVICDPLVMVLWPDAPVGE
jgi:hypothetical protein